MNEENFYIVENSQQDNHRLSFNEIKCNQEHSENEMKEEQSENEESFSEEDNGNNNKNVFPSNEIPNLNNKRKTAKKNLKRPYESNKMREKDQRRPIPINEKTGQEFNEIYDENSEKMKSSIVEKRKDKKKKEKMKRMNYNHFSVASYSNVEQSRPHPIVPPPKTVPTNSNGNKHSRKK